MTSWAINISSFDTVTRVFGGWNRAIPSPTSPKMILELLPEILMKIHLDEKKVPFLAKNLLHVVSLLRHRILLQLKIIIFTTLPHMSFFASFFSFLQGTNSTWFPLGRSCLWPRTPAALAVIDQPRKIASLRNGTEINLLIRKRYGKLDRVSSGRHRLERKSPWKESSQNIDDCHAKGPQFGPVHGRFSTELRTRCAITCDGGREEKKVTK